MFPSLKVHTSYTNSGEIFSRLLFLQENISYLNENLLLVVANETLAKKYLLVAQDIHFSLKKLEDYEDLVELAHSDVPCAYITTPDILDYSLSLSSLGNIFHLSV